MTRYLKLFGITVLLSASCVGLSNPAIASTYRSSSGTTVVVLNETNPANDGGFYFTKIAGRSWRGWIKVTDTSAGAGHTFYTGTFEDQTMGPGAGLTCTGTIRISRQNPGISDRILARATWQITGGNGCPDVGRTFSLELLESLPRPDRNGDFSPVNANTWMTQTNGEGTWPAWRVVSVDGQLNCRTSPNGSIKQVYSTRDRILMETRGMNAFTFSNGAPWMLTIDRCYVRANSQYLQPISIPF